MAVFALCVDKMLAFGYRAHLIFHHSAYREEGFLQLPAVYLGEEVGLVLHRVGACSEPFHAVDDFRLCVVAGRNEVVFVSGLLVERAELYQPVAHHVRVGRQSGAHLVHCVPRNVVPVFLVAVDNGQLAAVFRSHGGSHLEVFFARTVPFLRFFRPYLDVEAVRVQPLSCQLVHHN